MAAQIPLFYTNDLRQILAFRRQQMRQAIDDYDPDRLLNSGFEDLVAYFAEAYRIDAPVLEESEIVVDPREAAVDVSGRWEYAVIDRSRRTQVPGLAITMEIPFQGEQGLLLARPSRFSSRFPYGKIGNGVLLLEQETPSPNAEEIRQRFDAELELIRTYLGWVEEDVSKYNEELPSIARQDLENRRARLLRDRGVSAQLGYPLKRREDVSRTYAVREVRRKLLPRPPAASNAPFVPEPALADAEYEHILGVIRGMSLVLERSPKAFRGMGEEELRDHILVQLNAQYEGQATGETFNFEGKSDILIRVDGRNVFVGECKIWRGPKVLSDTVDQILGYATWRDTKTAIVLFNRNKDFSAVLAKIPEGMRGHPNFKRELSYSSESGFRYVLGHRDDMNRELTLTILAFEVPE